ncbi:FAD-dependent monooxygenase [Ramlibacter sp.]|uniref:FAD binding domain-containing protein n=1 Tax=Ramlibacter sp. TaxID=1917967 RepID=UPI003D0BFA06
MTTEHTNAGVAAQTPLRVAIIGGSLGGLMAALALRRAGFDVHVYERSRTTLQDRGAGLRVQQDLRNRLLGVDIDVDASTNTRSSDRFRFVGADNRIVYEERTQITYSSWMRLYDMLLGAVERERYHLDANVARLEPIDGGTRVHFSDGAPVDVDLVVAADGQSSGVREWLVPGSGPRYAGYVCWRGVVQEGELSREAREMLDGDGLYILPEGSHMSIYPIPQKSGGIAYAIVWYRPVSEPELPQLLVDKDGKQRDWSVPAGWLSPRVTEMLHSYARDELPAVAREVVLRTAQPFIQVIVDVETPRMVRGRVCVIGDAAFSGRPHLGAGTAKAADDAWTLAEALSNIGRGEVDAALARWEEARLALGRRYIALNRELGNALVAGRVPPERFTSRPSWEMLLENR